VADVDSLHAASEALARHDWQAAHDLAADAQCLDPLTEATRLDALADACWWLGRLDDCIEARRTAYRIFDELGEQRRAGYCAVRLYEDHCLHALPAIATGWLRRARRALDGDVACAEHGALLLREAELAHGAGDLDEAIGLAERARALGREIHSADIEAEALQTLGRVLIDSGRPRPGLAHLDEAMLLATEGRLGPYSTGKVYCSLISACEDLGDLHRAAEWTDATADWAEQHPFAIFPGICRVHRSVVLERQGALVEAEREAARACTELVDSHVPNAAAAFAQVGDVRRRLGNLDGADEAFAHAENLTGRTCVAAALLRLAQGRLADAQRIVSTCLEGQVLNRPADAQPLAVAVQVAIAADDQSAASAYLGLLREIATRYDAPMICGFMRVAEGRVLLARHDVEQACAALRDGVSIWQELGVPYEVATTKTLLGQALRESGDEPGAHASFVDARELFEQVGARLGPEPDTARTPNPAGLTDREVEVLRLVATGGSNKTIAAALNLSNKTVSRHLSNIFTKIDVTSRAAATAFAFEQHLIGPHS
jgi:ATP/maltotriose-dependent transcriptional regulator MalT